MGDPPLQGQPGYETLHDDDGMAVLYRPGTGPDCILSFTGIGRAMAGIDLQTPEFSRSNLDARKLFVIDKHRSWGNRLDWARLERIVSGVAQGGRVVTLGNSMGGFTAMLGAARFGASDAIAFVPQWSIDPAIVPRETRWTDYRAGAGPIVHRDLSDALDGRCRFHVFFGDHPMDRIHSALFPRDRDNLDLFLVRGGGHEVGRFLKEKGQLYSVIDACLDGGHVGRILSRAGIPFRTT
jgi:hypothetical protein